ncbi:hypothetical protein CKK33_02625 [Mucilaginibacter sp. MD40]|uniref:type II toxin-antitoxin system RelE/ParE family toxin n=1 Tax=Mucilaginibacter sp. MD40 TaxID=2029590 RepID=UPI000BACB4D2|nr:type II toxin-antitoxin system RelE/ParE family toxin [Mucilaginibacter sp. MD40]PAW92448.1 hypothetical protein CKK33_02625 [Mucilaginibacter sp. MD40]
MSRTVAWTPEATETFDIIVELIETKWGFASAQKFVRTANQTILTLASHPEMFVTVKGQTIRRAFITKQTSLFYEITEQQIILLYFWDNRQEPIL